MAFFQMAQDGANAQKNTGDFMGRQGRGKAEAQKNQNGKLDQANPAAGNGGKEIGNNGGHKKNQLSGEIKRHGGKIQAISRYYRSLVFKSRSMMRIPELVALEKLTEPLATRAEYAGRLLKSMLFGALMVILTLWIGMAGYHYLENLGWLDSFVNATMIMSGMGVVAVPMSDSGKLFAGSYALFCGLVLIVATAIAFTPVIHRFLHRMHVEADDDYSV